MLGPTIPRRQFPSPIPMQVTRRTWEIWYWAALVSTLFKLGLSRVSLVHMGVQEPYSWTI